MRRPASQLLRYAVPQSVTRRRGTLFVALGTLVCALTIVTGIVGWSRTTSTLSAALTAAALFGLWQVHRMVNSVQRGTRRTSRELRATAEQTQRRLVAAAEKARLAGDDRHQDLLDAIQSLRPQGSSRNIGALNSLLNLVRLRRPKTTLYLAGAHGALWLGYAAERFGGRVITLVPDDVDVAAERKLFDDHELTAVVELWSTSVRPKEIDGGIVGWYDLTAVEATEIDLLVVDAGTQYGEPRVLAHVLNELRGNLPPRAAVVVLDGARREQAEHLMRWRDLPDNFAPDPVDCHPHLVLSCDPEQLAPATLLS